MQAESSARDEMRLRMEFGAAKAKMADYADANRALHWFAAKLVVPGLVPGIHVLAELRRERRGWPGRSPAMTKKRTRVGASMNRNVHKRSS